MRTMMLFVVVTAIVVACDQPNQPASEQRPAEEEPVSKAVDILLFAPHGWQFASPPVAERLRRAKSDPAPFVQDLERRFTLVPIQELAADPRLAGKYGDTLALAGDLPSREATEFLTRSFLRIDDAATSETAEGARERLGTLTTTCLVALASVRSEPVISRLVLRLPAFALTQRVAAVEYLIRCCRGDKELAARIQRVSAAPASALRGDQVIEAALPLLRGEP